MEVTKTGRFITRVYGSAPAGGAFEALLGWIDAASAKALLSFADQVKKKGEEAEAALMRILSVFNRDEKGRPIIGAWMLRRCLLCTGWSVFNAKKNKDEPTKAAIRNGIGVMSPLYINFTNGNGKPVKKPAGLHVAHADIIKQPDSVKTHVTHATGRSFFTAYEFIEPGAEFTATMRFNEEVLEQKHFEKILSACGSSGLGAYRERFGWFEWVK